LLLSSNRGADDALGSQWYVGERAGKNPIPQTMGKIWEHPYRKGYEEAITMEVESIKARGCSPVVL
jgi:hypothetical protein